MPMFAVDTPRLMVEPRGEEDMAPRCFGPPRVRRDVMAKISPNLRKPKVYIVIARDKYDPISCVNEAGEGPKGASVIAGDLLKFPA